MLKKFSNYCEVAHVSLYTAMTRGLDELRGAAGAAMSRQQINALFSDATAEIMGHPMQDAILDAMRKVQATYLAARHSARVGLYHDECRDTLREFEIAIDGLSALRDLPAVQGGKQHELPDERPLLCSDDFASINWRGDVYTFSTNQASCIKVMYEAWQQGTPVMTQAAITGNADVSQAELRKVFETGEGHEAWGTLIVPAGKGKFRLAELSPKENPSSGKTAG